MVNQNLKQGKRNFRAGKAVRNANNKNEILFGRYVMDKVTNETIAARRAECLSLLTVWAEEPEIKLRRKGVVFPPKEREAVDAAKAKLAARIQKQPDEFWAEDMTAKARLEKLSEGLLQGVGGSM